jgi:uncharacterized protein DUF4157
VLAAFDSKKKNSDASPLPRHASAGARELAPEPNSLWNALALGKSGIQTKLAISQPDDPFELEADRVAERVMRMAVTQTGPEESSDSKPRTPHASPRAVHRKCDHCEEDEEKTIQRKVQGGNLDSPAAEPSPDYNRKLIGKPLDPSTRSTMESRFGHDFSRVRVHTDTEAANRARAVQARAYTIGSDIVFSSGEYAPATKAGRMLVAHELAHVVQQRKATIDPGRVEPKDSPAEREADAAAGAVTRGGGPLSIGAVPHGISRDVGWARRGPLPDPYGMGYNEILTNAGPSAEPAIRDLLSLEDAHMNADLAMFSALPSTRALDVLNLQPHAAGTACATWFPLLRARLQTQGLAVADPYGGPTSVSAHFFQGRSDRRALIIGGVHNRTEPQGAVVVERLRTLLTARLATGSLPFFTTVLVPNLFATARFSSGDPRWVKGGMGQDTQGNLDTSRNVEPNRNFPLPGEDLAAARARGASSTTAPELVFRDPANPSASPRAPQDTSGAGHSGTSIRMLPETRTLISLIEHFHPERIASVHAHSLKSVPGDAPGIFVDPRGIDPTTGVVTNAGQAAEDDRLATAMVRSGRTQLTSAPITGVRSPNPFVGNSPGTAQSTVRYATGAHAEGNSLGTWAPAPVTSGPGTRAGITTMTIEVPQWTDPSAATQLSRIEDLDRDLLADIFLEDPTVVTPATGPVTP